MNYKKFNCKKIEDVAKRREDLSSYNNNYYEDDEGNLIYQWSDDDNYADYCIVTFNEKGQMHMGEPFAESFCSCGNIMEVFSEFLKQGN